MWKKINWKHIGVMGIGTILISLGVALFKFAALGNDPFNGMAMSLANCTGIAYANLLVVINVFLLLIEILFGRHYIGIGTVVNALLQGYIVTFFLWLLNLVAPAPEWLVLKIVVMCIGVVICSLGISLYQTSDVGIAPYDSISLIMAERMPKVPYFWCRISNDAFCAIVCFATGGLIGLGTIVCAFGLGTVVHFFNHTFTEPLFRKIDRGQESAL